MNLPNLQQTNRWRFIFMTREINLLQIKQFKKGPRYFDPIFWTRVVVGVLEVVILFT